MNKHLGITFKCGECDKSFQYKQALQDHQRLHRGETFSCNNCKSQFNRRAEYYKHIKTCVKPDKVEEEWGSENDNSDKI